MQTTTYHKQLAQSIGRLPGFDFKANAGHEVADAIDPIMGRAKESLGK